MSITSGILRISAISGLVLGMTVCSATAAEHSAHRHQSHAATGKLVLNQGQKWATDDALRKGMDAIRDQMAAAVPAIHAGKLPAPDYTALANGVGAALGTIVAQCKLEPQADAQLHFVVADVLAGVDAMQGKVKKTSRQQGAVKVLGALDKYATYFDHPNWKPIKE